MAAPESERKIRILIAEDDPVQGRLLEECLHRNGFEVCGPFARCCDASEAALREDVDAALLDVSLEGGNSAAAASALRDRSIPFAFLTGYGPETAPVIGSFSDNLAIPKPISPDILDEVLGVLLSKQKQRADYHS
ncbi:MAG: response regulator [Parvularcula sp.]|jgi:DNA-binding response OmpR family regulator|nr:response regulator [Parvularcula sp.]